MKFALNDKILTFLKANDGKKYTAREIAIWIFENYPDECRQKQNRSTATINPIDNDNALLNQIVAEIGSQRPRLQKNNPEIKTTEGRPRKYYFTESTDSSEIDQVEKNISSAISNASESNVDEHALYPILSDFLWTELEVYSKRINEKKSKNKQGKNGNKWLYPDLTGMEDLSSDWDRGIKDCVKEYSDKKSKLWSFEVKILINRSNIREVFFQTVSNSSWANFGYLVSAEIEGADTMKELRILSGLHGIGYIKLDAENPSESQIMIPAIEKSEVDWDTANRVSKENTDFKNFIENVTCFYQTGKTKKSDWD